MIKRFKIISLIFVVMLFVGLLACEDRHEKPIDEELVITQLYYNVDNDLIVKYSNGLEENLGSLDVITNISIIDGELIVEYALKDAVNLGKLIGLSGKDGTDGKEVEFALEFDAIVWRYVGEEAWNNLIALETLKGNVGEQGPKGDQGSPGQDGKSAYEIYLDYFPDYDGTEEEWLIDLINGDLAVKQAMIKLISANNVVYEGEDVMFEFEMNNYELLTVDSKLSKEDYIFTDSTLTIKKEYIESFRQQFPTNTKARFLFGFIRGSESPVILGPFVIVFDD